MTLTKEMKKAEGVRINKQDIGKFGRSIRGAMGELKGGEVVEKVRDFN